MPLTWVMRQYRERGMQMGKSQKSFTSMLLETQWNGMAITMVSRMSITTIALESGILVQISNQSVVFTVRWCSEVNKLTSTGFRVLFRGELYDITSVDPMNYGKKTIKLHCRLERRQK